MVNSLVVDDGLRRLLVRSILMLILESLLGGGYDVRGYMTLLGWGLTCGANM